MRYLIALLVLFTATSALAEQRSTLYLMTRTDVASLHGGFQYALDRSPDTQALDWDNPATGLSGSTVPIRSFYTSTGQVCREYLSTMQLDGTIQQAFGTACRKASGGWQVVSEKSVKRAQSLKFVYRSQQLQTSPFAFSHPVLKQEAVQRMRSGENFHSKWFHEKIRNFKRGVTPAPEQRRIEHRQPKKLLKLVAY